MSIRRATKKDVNAITRIAVDSSENDIVCLYRFPKRAQFLDDHVNFSRATYMNFFEEDSERLKPGTEVMIYEYLQDSGNVTPVAFVVWKLPGQKTSTQPAAQPTERRDADPVRVQAFTAAVTKSNKELFNDRYGDKYVYLALVACDPQYQRKGIGEKLMTMAVDAARVEALPVVLYASPPGRRLYEKLGFKETGCLTVKVEGDEEDLRVAAMVLDV